MKTREQQIQSYIKILGIEALKPMQQSMLETVTKGDDTILLSPTGSGKTLAFLLPLIIKLDEQKEGVQLMILAPSRELAIQIEQVFRELKTGYKVLCSYGGHSIQTERNSFLHPPTVLIGTPGRIADHVRRERFSLDNLKFLVLDEFDKSLELGFQAEMKEIILQLKALKQRILTSATNLKDIPAFVGIKSAETLNFIGAEEKSVTLSLKGVRSEGKDKLDAFFKLVCHLGNEPMLVFVNHRDTADRISNHLLDMGLMHDVFHGGMQQEDRERALIKFRNGSHHLLITTDLASRGLDIPEIKYVIHYHLPSKEDAYIHRNGRTARMNAEGTVYLLLAEEEQLPEYIRTELAFEEVGSYTELPEAPDWTTIYIGSGKKEKVNKIDIVGLFYKKGRLQKDELGRIDVLDHSAFVAVKSGKVKKLLQNLKNEKIKGKKLRMELSK
ncbi:DEAD/DEAH box helicase [Carboxylicivirga linearis]|uniref:DEAD/DEAH box helicase n=1 Tax=Carboxylicivirga linearis TaxID=1628157 RepID=A0ABS5JY03_9BACT|nr:DEAD/DEAH box helicase [Carboxylicivirga linearis]MBS2099301.1 DEAD/DEAH box helicase [Carboxylicivirga linearis]